MTKEFLIAIGFIKDDEKDLPDWYSILDPALVTELKCPTYDFNDDGEFYVTSYFRPKEVFAEVAANDWDLTEA